MNSLIFEGTACLILRRLWIQSPICIPNPKLILITKKLIDILEVCQVSIQRGKTQIKVPVYAKQHNTINTEVHSPSNLGTNCKKRGHF